MKKHLVKQFDEEGTEDTHSIYKNNDAALKKEIKNFKVDESEVVIFGKKWTIEKTEGNEVRCVAGKNVQYFDKKEIKEELQLKKIEELNKKFNAYKEFSKQYGTLYSYYKDKKIMILHKCHVEGTGKNSSFVDTEYIVRVSESKSISGGVEVEFEIEYSSHGVFSFFDFDENGDFKNRDYNIDLNEYQTEEIAASKLMKHFEKLILEIGPLEYSSGKYFNKNFCYIPYMYDESKTQCGVKAISVRSDKKSYQAFPGKPIYKKGKNVEKRSAQDLLDDVKKLMPAKFVKSFE